MSTDTANSASAESVSASDAISFGDAMGIDFEDGADEANRQEADDNAAETSTDEASAEADEQDVGAAADEEQAQGDEQDDAEERSKPTSLSDETLVTLDDGSELSLGQLKKERMFEKDYRHKTHQNGIRERELVAKSNRVDGVLNALVDHLASRLPPEPDIGLASSNPAAYVQQKAMHDAAQAQLQVILQQGADAKAVVSELNEQQLVQKRNEEGDKLAEYFPHLRDPKTHADFKRVTSEALNQFGFTTAEYDSMPDARLTRLLHYAHKGMQAEQAKQKVAQKIVNVPPVTPPAKRQERQQDAAYKANKDNMARLRKSGRIQDAMKVDFD